MPDLQNIAGTSVPRYQATSSHYSLIPYTRTVIPQSITVKVGKFVIGYVQTIEYTQTRDVNQSNEVGTVGIVDQQPKQPSYKGSLAKLKIYKANILKNMMESLKDDTYSDFYGWMKAVEGDQTDAVFQKIIHNIYPFDIEVHEFIPGLTSNNMLTHKLQEVFITDFGFTSGVGDSNITETANFVFKDISYSVGTVDQSTAVTV